MTVTLTDNNGLQLSLGDVIMVNYPNQKIKFIGELIFDDEEARFKLSDGESYHPLKPSYAVSIEKLGHITEYPGYKKQFGKIEGCTKKQLDFIYSLRN